MRKQMDLGGIFTLTDTSISVKRMGYGAMQLAGSQVWGPPRDVDAAIEVLREAVAAGVNNIYTNAFYCPHFTNQIIKRGLRQYDLIPPRLPPGGPRWQRLHNLESTRL